MPTVVAMHLAGLINGIGLTDIQPVKVPVLCDCAVTIERVIASARVPFAITRALGHISITARHTDGQSDRPTERAPQ